MCGARPGAFARFAFPQKDIISSKPYFGFKVIGTVTKVVGMIIEGLVSIVEHPWNVLEKSSARF